MTDFLAPASPEIGSQFDVSNLDKSIRSISAVESQWRLPELPDEVKLDLATFPELDEAGTTEFLTGLERDFFDEDDEFSEVDGVEEPPLRPVMRGEQRERSGLDNLRVITNDILVLPAPTQPDVDAVTKFKMRAIERGLMERPPDGVVDASWDSGMNSVFYDMAFDDYQRRLTGDESVDSMSTRTAVDMIAEWTQPGNLLAAAADLDLLPDIGAIVSETTGWLDKWRKVGDSKNPFDFGKNLLDAALGPIDDIAMPILTWAAIIGSGGSATLALAPKSFMAARYARFATDGSRFGAMAARFGGATDLAAASGLANRLSAPARGATSQAIGGAMKAWRSATPVVRTKQIVQPGMRLGVLSQAQQALPSYASDGFSLSDVPGVSSGQERLRRFSDSFWSLPLELAVAPQNIFSPGTFLGKTGLASNTLTSVTDLLGSPVGRTGAGALTGAAIGAATGDDLGDVGMGAAIGGGGALILPRAGRALGNQNVASVATGAVLGGTAGGAIALMDDVMNEGESEIGPWDAFIGGAVAGAAGLGIKSAVFRSPNKNRMVGFVSNVARKSEWKRIAGDEELTSAFHEALISRSQGYRDAASESDGTFLGTWSKWTGISDEATVGGEMMSWITGYTLHRAAKLMAGVDDIDDGPRAYYGMLDKLRSQMRQYNLDDGMESVFEAAARNRARSQNPDDLFGEKYEEYLDFFRKSPDRALEMIGHQNRMSRDLMTQLFLMEGAAAKEGADGAADFLRKMREDPGAGMDEFADYISRNIDAVGDWATYQPRMDELLAVEVDGLLDGARLHDVDTPLGSRPVKGDRILTSKASRELDRSMDGRLFDPDADPGLLTAPTLQPLGDPNPTGRMVLAKATTKSAQELEQRAAELENYEGLYRALDATSDLRATGALDTISDPLSMSEQALSAALKAAGANGGQTTAMRRIVVYARSRGLSVDQVGKALDKAAREALDDTEFWTQARMPTSVRASAGDGLPMQTLRSDNPVSMRRMIQERVKQINKKAHYTAATVDVDSHLATLREVDPKAADRLEGVIRAAEADGYRLVHGVDYTLPSDLAKIDQFKDLTVRHTNAITMGNFFKGKLPAVAHANQERRQRAAISAALMNVGKSDATPESDRVTQVVADLYDILQRAQDEVAETISSMRQQGVLQRVGTRVSSTGTPLRIEDLAGSARQKRLFDGLAAKGYDQDEIKAIWKAVPKFRNAEFQDVGLYAIEAGMRERNQLAGALKVFNRPTLRGAAGAYSGAAVGSSTADPDASEAEVRMRQLGFGLLGGAAGLGGNKALSAVTGGATTRMGERIVDAADMARYGYVADGIARMRDTLRFTLSPMFDLSRYVEGYMLGQIGGPMRYPRTMLDESGKVIAQAGERVALPYNISPSGLRSRIAKDLGGGPAAQATAETRFNQYLSEFRQAARGDFDPQELDSTGRWFAQVGIMGFNPTDWMTSAFAELRRAGFSSDEAYRHARGMYTYGTTGRSAAEMSVNFVVFPFSFQKKALTHVAEWITDDLARSWILHDSFKAYDMLSEQYELDEVWREHLPALQQLRRLNMFAYGLSAGQWGGINRRIMEPAVKAGSELAAQLFTPGAYSIGERLDVAGVVSAAELTELHESLIPAINDISWMIENAKEQGNVVSSGLQGGEWLTSRAQASKGWDEWNTFRDQTQANLQSRGLSWADLYNKEWLSDERLLVEAQRAELAAMYPSWADAQVQSTANSAALEMERKNRIVAASANLETATQADFQMDEMENLIDQVQRQLGYQGIKVGGSATWADAPPDAFYAIQGRGREMLEANPSFSAIWEKFYRPQFGLLEARI